MASRTDKISLIGSVSLGTGVMIGAGIFALVGQVAEFAGDFFPLAFLLGAIVAAVSSYSYIRYSSVNPSAGGIAMLLKDAYGPGVVAGSFSLFMYVSMVVAESLLARTFGTYLLRPFGLQDSVILVPILGVAAIATAAIVNFVGNTLVERSATITAVAKILGIAVLAIAGLIGVAVGGDGFLAQSSGDSISIVGVLAGTTLCVLAYKGFTTITNQGDDLRDPKRNIARSILISLAICTVLYLLITVSVSSSIGASGAVDARNYALAQAAEPFFGAWGVGITVAIAVVATLSGLLASLYSVSRLYGMLQEMKQAPSLPKSVPHQPMIITAGLAILVTVFLDLSQIASMGVFLYLTMDMAVQWGVIRRLRDKIEARMWLPVLTIVLDLVILIPFAVLKIQSDLFTVIVAAVVAAAIVVAQVVTVRMRSQN
ncbi:amino acid/polyamine/organocation transporter (APC superfamily) [Salinibacterium amurskyense]|uniref:Amino acid/polyamine/organocation transporter (APC superfamily) n=1 Tax=Salinibacterium amurskyense TaxID=205941 RepID=A0A2M9D6A5_9MICO|nr:APC family permease [Salinibacterium amurskyense]PJJ81236.1 amino acid/polyamine/organocation transporter (APC superfamily) [Salinibacterium amurskyense]RLQ83254.1 APC family permease [Salinibacterium amurskyense]GHD81207.1 amino acid permease [Salinibacterium amurskyense]